MLMPSSSFSSDEPARLAALRRLSLLDTPAEARFDRLTRLAGRLFAAPVALITLIDAERQWFKSLFLGHGEAPGQDTPRELAFCARTIGGEGVFVVEDAFEDARFADNPLVTGSPHIRFYAGAPLHASGGERVGSLCVIDRVPRAFGAEDRAALRDLADVVEAELAELDRSSLLSELAAHREVLHEEREFLSALVETVDAGIVAYDTAGHVTFLNGLVREALGEDDGEGARGIVPEGVSLFHLDGRPMALDETPAYRALQGITTQGLELRIQGPGGQLYNALASSRPLYSPQGERRGAVLVMHDITGRKQAEEALAQSERSFHAFMDYSPAVAYMKDSEGRYVYVNQRFLDQANASREAVIGRTDFELFPAPVAEGFRASDHRAMEADEPFIVLEQQVPQGDRSSKVRQFLSFKFRIRNATGEQLLGGVAIDVTERQELDRLRDDFIGMVSHELRTPMTAIKGSLSLLASGMIGELPEKAQRMVDLALSSSDRLIRLINDFLDFQRMEAGVVVLEPEQCDPAEVLQEAAESLQALADAKNVRLHVVCDASTAWADADRVVQVLINLLGNAIKFSPVGGEVCLAACQEADWVRFQVRDQGRGIPEEQLTAIFNRFHQVEPADAKAGGTGLGLAISRHLVRQHGGKIWAANHPEGGAMLSFTLPCRAQAAPRPSAPAELRLPFGPSPLSAGAFPCEAVARLLAEEALRAAS